MEMRVNEKLCTGCGVCVPVCPVGAIRLKNGLADIDQTVCVQCQACVEACPQGAIAASEMPVLAAKPALIQPANQAEIVIAEPVPSNEKPWLATVLAFAGQEIFPRLADALVAALDRRLAQVQTVKSQTKNMEPTPTWNSGQGYRRQRRSGYGRRPRGGQGRGQGRGIGKGKWF